MKLEPLTTNEGTRLLRDPSESVVLENGPLSAGSEQATSSRAISSVGNRNCGARSFLVTLAEVAGRIGTDLSAGTSGPPGGAR